MVSARETVGFSGFVLEDSGGDESSHADVQYTALAGHDVYVIALLAWMGQQIPPWSFAPRRNDKLKGSISARLDVTLRFPQAVKIYRPNSVVSPQPVQTCLGIKQLRNPT